MSRAVNRHNCHFWDDRRQFTPSKMSVWILGTRIIASLLILGTLTSGLYLTMSEDVIDTFIAQITDYDHCHNIGRLQFQQDGASPLYVVGEF